MAPRCDEKKEAEGKAKQAKADAEKAGKSLKEAADDLTS
jgi:uncharacterized protein YjbJ (UPF0337 family)